jgi:catechol 2,3-dioxygenase-like lactoylglutathione lyase family enzyme
MAVRRIDHVLVAMPAGREEEARAFYHGMLGLAEKAKPPQLAARGGCWFESGAVTVHLGVDKNFVAARKAHPAFIVDDLAGLETKLKQAGYKVTEDEPIVGCDRRHVDDPFGNRIELIEPR